LIDANKLLNKGDQDMSNSQTAVFAIFPDQEAVEEAVDALRASNFRAADISVLFSSTESSKEFAHEQNTKAPEGAATGVAAGAVVGGGLGWLAGIGAIAIPGVGPLIAAGPIMAMLAGAAGGGALGGLTGALVGLGIPEYEAKRYEGLVKDGGILLSVHCDDSDWVDKAKSILEECEATDIGSKSEASADYPTSERPRMM